MCLNISVINTMMLHVQSVVWFSVIVYYVIKTGPLGLS